MLRFIVTGTHFLLPSSPPRTHPPICWWTIPLPLLQCLLPDTPHRAEGGGAGGGLSGCSFPWCFYWPQQMASLSLCIVVVAILLSGSGLTIVASSSGRQKPSQLQKRVSSVTECCKTGNAVKFTAFTRCKGNYCLSGSGGEGLIACMSQVWEMFRVQLVRIVWKYQITI